MTVWPCTAALSHAMMPRLGWTSCQRSDRLSVKWVSRNASAGCRLDEGKRGAIYRQVRQKAFIRCLPAQWKGSVRDHGGIAFAERLTPALATGPRSFNQGEVVMKRDTTTNTGTVKTSASPDPHALSAAPWQKTEKRSDAPAPPPVWTRYIDSRLKQFCVR